jgi:MtfA peptidase
MWSPWGWWRRRRYLKTPFPAEWAPIVAAKFPFVAVLEPEEAERFRTHLKLFIWEKYWFGAHGLEVTDEMRVVIAGVAARLSRNLSPDVYGRLTEIVIYPSHYKHPRSDAVVFGEARTWGTIVLSWDAVRHGIANPNDGHNTAAHELAHVLDISGGAFDGTPPLETQEDYEAWVQVFSRHYLALTKRPHRGVLRRYGATNEAEFFAVATETFFEKSEVLQRKAPDLYEQLRRYYRVDPAAVRRKRR